MKELLIDIDTAVRNEYSRAASKFGERNNSDHESYAVILEEYQEAIFEAETFLALLDNYWLEIKANKRVEARNRLSTMAEFAKKAAAEWVQVAAMCHKAEK